MRSATTSQSNTTSPEPISASALRSVSLTRPCASAPPAKACCMTVKPMSMTMSTRPPISAGGTRSRVREPVTVKLAATTQTSSRNQVGMSITARS